MKKYGRSLFLYLLVMLFLVSATGIAFAAGGKGESAGPVFTDAAGDTNAVYINYMAKRGIISGFPDGTFHPAQGLTRAQAAVLVNKVLGLQASPGESSFSDVDPSHWAAGYINSAAKAGYITGFPDGSFHPEESLTRAQGISLFLRLSKEDMSQVELPVLSDMDNSHWAAQSVAVALAAGMIGLSQDQSSFYPDQEFRRGDLARALGILLTQDLELSRATLQANLKVKSGEVQVSREGQEVKIVNNSINLVPGDIVITQKGEAEISFPDGSGLLVKNNTKLVLTESRGKHYIKYDGSSGIAVDWLEVELLQGKIFGALASKYNDEEQEADSNKVAVLKNYKLLASRDHKFDLLAAGDKGKQPWYKTAEKKKVKVQVDMPWGIAAIRGSFWSNTVTNTSNSTNLLEGEAEVTAGGSTRVLGRMQNSTIGGRGQSPSSPAAMSSSEQREWLDNKQWVETRTQEIVNNQEAPQTPPPAPDALPTSPQPQAPGQSQAPAQPQAPAKSQAPAQSQAPALNALNAINNALAESDNDTEASKPGPNTPGGSGKKSTPSTPVNGSVLGNFSLQNAAVVNVDGQSVVLTQDFGVSPAARLNATEYEVLVKSGADYNHISERIPVTQKVRYLGKLFEQPENLAVKFYQQGRYYPVGIAWPNGNKLEDLANRTISGTISLESGVAPAGGMIVCVMINGECSLGYDHFEQEVVIPAGASSVPYTLYVPENLNAKYGYWVSYYLHGTYSEPYLRQGEYTDRVSVIDGNRDNINLTIGLGQVISGKVVLPAANNSGRKIYVSISASGNRESYGTGVSFDSGQQEATYSLVVALDDYRLSYYINDDQFCRDNRYMMRGYYKSSTEIVGEYSQAATVTVGTEALSGIDFNVLPGGYYISGTISLPSTAGKDVEVHVGAQDTNRSGISIYYMVVTIPAGQLSANYTIFVDQYSTRPYRVGYNIRDGSFCRDNNYICTGYYSTTGMVNSTTDATELSVNSYGMENINLSVMSGGVLISGNINMPSNQVVPAGGLDVIIHAGDESKATYSTAITIPVGASSVAYKLLVPDVSRSYMFFAELPEYNTYQPNLATLAFEGTEVTDFDLTLQPVSQSGGGGGGGSGGISPDAIANHSILVCGIYGKAFNINSSEYTSTNIAEIAGTCGLYYKSGVAETSGLWFDLLNPDATSEAYFSNSSNAVSPLVLGTIRNYEGNVIYFDLGSKYIVVPTGWTHSRTCQVMPDDATLEIVTAPDSDIAEFDILPIPEEYPEIWVKGKSPGTTSVSLKASKDGLTYEKAVPIRVIPILTITPASLPVNYNNTSMTVSEAVYSDSVWDVGDLLQLQLFMGNSADPVTSVVMPSVTAEESSFTFTLPSGLEQGEYGLVVYISSNPVGIGRFRVGSIPILNPSIAASVDAPFKMLLTNVDYDWFAASHRVYIGEVNDNNEVEHSLEISGDQCFLTLDPTSQIPSASLLRTPGNKTVTIITPDANYPPVSANQMINAGKVASTSLEIKQELALGQTSTVTIVLKDQYDNICSSGEHVNVTIMGDVHIANTDSTTDEIYNLDNGALTDQLVEGVCQMVQWVNGPSSSFSITIPQSVDPGDGFSIQLFIELDGTTGYSEDRGDIAIGLPIQYPQ